ncbi:spermidine/putrescine ABC transporter permease PotC [Psychrosphaera sp. F3M07]|uniref:Spermidine/putrescine ABC transporter permease PotC n=1 Tax=Psychrosphaera aquimarina TaxID=2044854 RepID=A0ABU3QW13_9GAMM|nr:MULTISPECIES: spermidine/putrescine ABC transporter permease PotC [Psychrosphaera]MBU2918478.1 spermidine/putrescine ABC transporter permease PotC [Psychrosphaera sp. F3M07]MDU0111464.1 spermidine/putrescine ABC transporter permease PotC [Psychrosphaera aquimarina]
MKIFKPLFILSVFVYLYLPMLVLITNSFNQSKYGHKWAGFSWKWYEKLWNNTGLMDAFVNSLTIAVLTAFIATLLGTLMALAIHRYKFRLKSTTSSMLFILMMSPDIVLAITFLIIFIALGIQLGFWSLLIAHITFCLPFVVITVYAQLKGFDNNILEAAQDLGASEGKIFRVIILPMILPAVLSGWLLSFTLSLDDVIISSFVTGPGFEILPIRVFSMVKVGVSPEVNALATILLVISLSAIAVISLLIKRKQ